MKDRIPTYVIDFGLKNANIYSTPCEWKVKVYGKPTKANFLEPINEGVLYSVDLEEEFVEKAILYIEDPTLKGRLAKAGQRWVKEQYSVENEIETFKRIYQEVMCPEYSLKTE